MTVEYAAGEVVSICEANLDDYAVMYMTKCADRTLQAKYDGSVVNVSANTEAQPVAHLLRWPKSWPACRKTRTSS